MAIFYDMCSGAASVTKKILFCCCGVICLVVIAQAGSAYWVGRNWEPEVTTTVAPSTTPGPCISSSASAETSTDCVDLAIIGLFMVLMVQLFLGLVS